ncbi:MULTISPECIES: hypothetical protein [unclassified Streptomyces]|uniref:hypothetical protein n=1 Tax=unclassified Streptomyces TaxID=2593676 RepID=UPI00331C3675
MSRRNSLTALALSALLTAGLAVGQAGTAAAAPAKYTDAQARKLLKDAGFAIKSSGGCSNPGERKCTSFQGVNRTTVSGIIRFKRISKCAKVRITAGTETGHSRKGSYRHDNGYKLDISRSDEWVCATRYIKKHFKFTGYRKGDRAAVYTSVNGNTYALEGDHWDITYFNGSA